MRLGARDPSVYAKTACCKCGTEPRYIWQDEKWCKTCLDNEQYPHLAHLTQEERDEMRRTIRKPSTGIVNAKGIGFN